MRLLLPYPLLALAFLLLWLLLVESVSPGAILLGVVLAVAGCSVLAVLGVPKGRLGRLRSVPGLLVDVLVEIVRSNNAVARMILQPRALRGRQSGFVLVPLDMRSPYGLAALACIVTATPGTVWVEYDAQHSTMLLHVLDLVDEETWVRTIKGKWERRLMEIFE
jgi:multicomponent K+:H+ antiporter subunit E